MMTTGMRQKQEDLYNKTLALFDEVSDKAWLAEGMREHGYDADRWAFGEALAATAHDLARARAVAEATQLGATDTFNRMFDRAWPHFQLAIQTSVDVLQGQTEYLDLLGLHEARQNGVSQISKPGKRDNDEQTLAWLDNYYEVALDHPAIAATLTANNLPPAKLAKDAAWVRDLKQANRHKEQAITAKSRAVKDRNDAFEQLRPWLRRAQRTARTIKKEHAAQQTATAGVEV